MRLTALLLLFCVIPNAIAASGTQTQLNQLEARINAIKAQLLHDQSEKDKLYKSLGDIEKKIGKDLRELHEIKIKVQQKQVAIQTITNNINTLNKTLKTQQDTLAHHLRTRHKLGTVHPWQYLLNQEKAKHLSKLFVFYQYLFQTDRKLIEQIRETTLKLAHEKILRRNEKESLKKLQTKLTAHQANLLGMKVKQHALINALERQIKTKNDQLITYRGDKLRLQSLLTRLSQKRITRPTATHKEKLKLGTRSLNYPLKSRLKTTKLLNQGLVFLAGEGTPVLSVLPGKVIFSDWLKGYGLLLIIDHGNGLMSLYAHNASLFVHSGISVKQGEQIATVGHTGGLRENGLYFEVRNRGRAIPPREWMS